MTKRIVFLISVIVLSILSVYVSTPSRKEVKNYFKYFGYSILVNAEKCLADRDYEKAFSLFRTVVSRATLNGDNSGAKKIKNRMAACGKEKYKLEGELVWKFIEYYAVNSSDFEKSATIIENWFLTNNLGKECFDYNLKRKTDIFSYWETDFSKYSYIIRKISSRFMMENQKQVLRNEMKIFGEDYCVGKISLNLIAPHGIRNSILFIEGISIGEESFLLGSKGYTKVGVENGKGFLLIQHQEREFNIKQVIVRKTRKLPFENVGIYLRREYKLL